MSASKIKQSTLYSDLMADIDSLYLYNGSNLEKKLIEIEELYSNSDSLGILMYSKEDAQDVLKELNKISSFRDNNGVWKIGSIDWNTPNMLWTQGWGMIKFKMKISESEMFSRKHKYNYFKNEKELKIDLTIAPDLGLCMWGDTDDFVKRAKFIASGLSRTINFLLEDWQAKTQVSSNDQPSLSMQCECGAVKTYGKNVDPFFHSRWCRLFSDKG